MPRILKAQRSRRQDPWAAPFDLETFATALGYYDFMDDLRRHGREPWNVEHDGPAPERWFMNEDGWQFQVRDGMFYREHWWCVVYERGGEHAGRSCDDACTVYSIQVWPLPRTVREAFDCLIQWVEEIWTAEDAEEFLTAYHEAEVIRVRRVLQALLSATTED